MYVHTSATTTFSRNYCQVFDYITIYKDLGKALQQGQATHHFLSTLRNTRGQHVYIRYTASMLQYHDHATCLASTQNGDALTSLSFHEQTTVSHHYFPFLDYNITPHQSSQEKPRHTVLLNCRRSLS